MTRADPIQHSFNSGELGPWLLGRQDIDRYANGLKSCVGVVPTIQGPLIRLPGSKHVVEVKDSTQDQILVHFEFSTTQAYIIEFGDQYIRFYRNQGIILESDQTITAITQANPGVLTITSHGFSNDEQVYISGIGGMVEIVDGHYIVKNSTTHTFTLEDLDGNAIDTTSYTAFTSGGTAARVYEISSPYLEADLRELKFAQSADVLYIAHPDYDPRKLTRTGNTAWTLNEIIFIDGPYLVENAESTTLTPSATTGSGITITASAITGINDDTGFQSTDVGRLIRIKHSSTWGNARIVGYTSTTQVTADVNEAFGATTASEDWRLGVWSDTTGYPAAVTFHEDRLWWGGGINYPLRIDGSESTRYEQYAPTTTDGTVNDDNAVAITLISNDVNNIVWLHDDEKGLMAGTVRGEWLVRPNSNNEAITSTNINAKRSTTYGSKPTVAPVRADKAILFVQRAGKKLRELAYVFEDDGFRAQDLSVLAHHLPYPGITAMAYAQQPLSVIWMVRSDGVLLSLTYEPDQDVRGWSRHTLGGYSDSGNTTAAKAKSVAVIPNSAGTGDETWLVVERYINGRTRKYVEYLTDFWEVDTEKEDAFFVHSGATYSGSATTTISGLGFLEGEEVTILADGATHPNRTVSSGSVTLQVSAEKVHIGYGFESYIETLPRNAGSQTGTAQGKTTRVHRVFLRFWNSLNTLQGVTGNMKRVTFRKTSDSMDSSPGLFTGDQDANFADGYSDDGVMRFEQDQPLPWTLVAVMPQGVTYDR